MPPAKITKAMFITNAKDYISTDFAIVVGSVFAWAAAYFSEIITALPVMVGFLFQMWLRYKKYQQAERQREELHRETMRLLREGKLPAEEVKPPDFDN